MSVLNNSNAIESGGYNIDRSLRFRSSASAYLNRTPASAGNRQKWTWSGWVKKGSLNNGGSQWIWGANNTVLDSIVLDINANGTCNLSASINSADVFYTTASYRDPSAWYHIIISVDTTQATASNRIIPYVNGVQVTSFSYTNYPSQNTNTATNAAVLHTIGRRDNSSNYFDGYLAEVNFIDGQALTPSSFGQTDAVTGVWQPKKYTGTYGTNGFYLPFSDNTSATTLAYDKSGNGNNWTANNISTTAGSTYDSMTDVPTLTSATAANYCTWNPLDTNGASNIVSGNLNNTANSGVTVRGTIVIPNTGLFYAEYTSTSGTSNLMDMDFGVMPISATRTWGGYGRTGVWSFYASNNRAINRNGTMGAVTGGAFAANSVIQVATDLANNRIWLGINNVWIDGSNGTTGNPSALTNPTVTGLPVDNYALELGFYNTSGSLNCGQRPFSYTPPTGFKALNTYNLPDPTIKKPNQYMDASLWTGNGTSQSIVNTSGFQPDLVWTKSRGGTYGAYSHALFDSVRGVGANKELTSDQTYAEGGANSALYGYVSALNSNGFNLAAGSTNSNQNNGTGTTYVGWQWKKGATPGFDIVTYTGDGSTGTGASARAIAHSLGVAPKFIIVKARNAVESWPIYHASLGASKYAFLNVTDAAYSGDFAWSNTPTASNFYVTANGSVQTNGSGRTFVAYLFAEIAGFSKFGSYTGNGSADGPFVYCGFRPKYVLVKPSTLSLGWNIYDSTRSPYNTTNLILQPNLSNAESNSTLYLDMTSNGFKIRTSLGELNQSGQTYIFAAFAEFPTKYSLAR